jgi:hypothetical protein
MVFAIQQEKGIVYTLRELDSEIKDKYDVGVIHHWVAFHIITLRRFFS